MSNNVNNAIIMKATCSDRLLACYNFTLLPINAEIKAATNRLKYRICHFLLTKREKAGLERTNAIRKHNNRGK